MPGTPAGAGIILTPSGLVLTSDQVLQGARRVTVRVVLSGRSFPARLVGADASHGLGLLQIVGRAGFRPVAVGNSRYLGRGAAVTAVGSSGLTRTFTLDIGNLTGGTGAVAAGGQRLTGLLVSTARVVAGEETGGPLVNLSGPGHRNQRGRDGQRPAPHRFRGAHQRGPGRGPANPGRPFALKMSSFCQLVFPELPVGKYRITDGRIGNQQQRPGQPGESRWVPADRRQARLTTVRPGDAVSGRSGTSGLPGEGSAPGRPDPGDIARDHRPGPPSVVLRTGRSMCRIVMTRFRTVTTGIGKSLLPAT